MSFTTRLTAAQEQELLTLHRVENLLLDAMDDVHRKRAQKAAASKAADPTTQHPKSGASAAVQSGHAYTVSGDVASVFHASIQAPQQAIGIVAHRNGIPQLEEGAILHIAPAQVGSVYSYVAVENAAGVHIGDAYITSVMTPREYMATYIKPAAALTALPQAAPTTKKAKKAAKRQHKEQTHEQPLNHAAKQEVAMRKIIAAAEVREDAETKEMTARSTETGSSSNALTNDRTEAKENAKSQVRDTSGTQAARQVVPSKPPDMWENQDLIFECPVMTKTGKKQSKGEVKRLRLVGCDVQVSHNEHLLPAEQTAPGQSLRNVWELEAIRDDAS